MGWGHQNLTKSDCVIIEHFLITVITNSDNKLVQHCVIKFIHLRLFGDIVSPCNNFFGDGVMKTKTTREFSINCVMFPESSNKLFIGLMLFGDTGKGTLCHVD